MESFSVYVYPFLDPAFGGMIDHFVNHTKFLGAKDFSELSDDFWPKWPSLGRSANCKKKAIIEFSCFRGLKHCTYFMTFARHIHALLFKSWNGSIKNVF